MDSEADDSPTAWQETTGMVRPFAPRSISSRTAAVPVDYVRLTDLTPATPAQFAAALTPCLSLSGGIGMDQAARREWLNAAYRALHDIPADLARRGADAAMLTADHPSKIVPAINAAIATDWAWRRRMSTATAAPIALPLPEETDEERAERLAVRDLVRGLARKLEANIA